MCGSKAIYLCHAQHGRQEQPLEKRFVPGKEAVSELSAHIGRVA